MRPSCCHPRRDRRRVGEARDELRGEVAHFPDEAWFPTAAVFSTLLTRLLVAPPLRVSLS
eukprot:4360859-Pyramimonas_sp.AAC.1